MDGPRIYTSNTSGMPPRTFTARLDPDLHTWLAQEAEREGLSINAMLSQILGERYAQWWPPRPPWQGRPRLHHRPRDPLQETIDKFGEY